MAELTTLQIEEHSHPLWPAPIRPVPRVYPLPFSAVTSAELIRRIECRVRTSARRPGSRERCHARRYGSRHFGTGSRRT